MRHDAIPLSRIFLVTRILVSMSVKDMGPASAFRRCRTPALAVSRRLGNELQNFELQRSLDSTDVV